MKEEPGKHVIGAAPDYLPCMLSFVNGSIALFQ